MPVKQISVLLGNVPGTLSRVTNILDKEDITTKALLAASGRQRFWKATVSITRSPRFWPPRCLFIPAE